jgi:prepilin-type processing-associated H-X9-DG protein
VKPRLVEFAPERVRRSHDAERCRAQLEAIGVAIRGYADRHGGEAYPEGTGSRFLLRLPGVRPEQLLCPARGPRVRTSFRPLYRGPGLTLSSDLPADTPVACDEEGQHPGGLHVLYLDGRVEFVPQGTPEHGQALEATIPE